jgi:glutamate-1-semialdehyde 2,1-aminomutase
MTNLTITTNYLAGGTNSPIPYPANYPKLVLSGKEAYVYDEAGKEYIDMWMGYGALILGHGNQKIAQTVCSRMQQGHFFSYPTQLELELADLLHKQIPCAELVRFATSGSDAVAYAIRGARSYTQRNKVLSVVGGYHGVHENMIPSKGALTSKDGEVDLVKFNDFEEARLKLESEEYACFILEPVMANSGCTIPVNGYLEKIRELCSKTKTVLIFDEVVTGFRLSLGGAQHYYNVIPDMATFSKAIANGLPLSAVCGKKDIMNQFTPVGQTFFAGTFNGSPISLASALQVQQILKEENVHALIGELGKQLRSFIDEVIQETGINACVQGVGSMFTIAFNCKQFTHGLSVQGMDSKTYNKFISILADKGILFPPLQSETVFLSPVHASSLEFIKQSIKETFYELK